MMMSLSPGPEPGQRDQRIPGYGRDHEVTVSGDGDGDGAGDAAAAAHRGQFRLGLPGNPGGWNPEQLLTAALAQCHMLPYLHACAPPASWSPGTPMRPKAP